MEIVNLKKDDYFIRQYVDLRNHYVDLLLTSIVNVDETKKWLKKPDIEVKGLIEKNVLLGAVILYLDKDGEIAFFTKNPGKGLGGKLLMIIEEVAREKKLKSVWAWVLQDNVAAQKAFKKKGYVMEKIVARKYNNKNKPGIIFRKGL